MQELQDSELEDPEQINTPLLTEQIADKICRFIHQRRLSEGIQIPNEFALARLFHVGRGTIREAVKLLISRNILEIHRGKGTFVCEKPGIVDDPFGFTYTENKIQLVGDLITIRYILEPEIAALAAQYATDQEIEQMNRIAGSIEDRAKENKNYNEEDIAFHTLIAEGSRNMVMPNLIPVIHYGIELYNQFLEKYETLKALSYHYKIIQAIEAHDGLGARQAMQQHLEYNKKNVQSLLAAKKTAEEDRQRG